MVIRMKKIYLLLVLLLMSFSLVSAANPLILNVTGGKYSDSGILTIDCPTCEITSSFKGTLPTSKYGITLTKKRFDEINDDVAIANKHFVLCNKKEGCVVKLNFKNDLVNKDFGKFVLRKGMFIIHNNFFPETLFPFGKYTKSEVEPQEINDISFELLEGVVIDFVSADRQVPEENAEHIEVSKYPIKGSKLDKYFDSFRLKLVPLYIDNAGNKKFRPDDTSVDLPVCGYVFSDIHAEDFNGGGSNVVDKKSYFQIYKNKKLAPNNCEAKYYKLSTGKVGGVYKCGYFNQKIYFKGQDLSNIVCQEDFNKKQAKLTCSRNNGCRSQFTITDIGGDVDLYFSNLDKNKGYLPLGSFELDNKRGGENWLYYNYKVSSELNGNNDEKLKIIGVGGSYSLYHIPSEVSMFKENGALSDFFVELPYGDIKINEDSHSLTYYIHLEKNKNPNFKYVLQFRLGQLYAIKASSYSGAFKKAKVEEGAGFDLSSMKFQGLDIIVQRKIISELRAIGAYSKGMAISLKQETAKKEEIKQGLHYSYYTIKEGDTLNKIMKHFGQENVFEFEMSLRNNNPDWILRKINKGSSVESYINANYKTTNTKDSTGKDYFSKLKKDEVIKPVGMRIRIFDGQIFEGKKGKFKVINDKKLARKKVKDIVAGSLNAYSKQSRACTQLGGKCSTVDKNLLEIYSNQPGLVNVCEKTGYRPYKSICPGSSYVVCCAQDNNKVQANYKAIVSKLKSRKDHAAERTVYDFKKGSDVIGPENVPKANADFKQGSNVAGNFVIGCKVSDEEIGQSKNFVEDSLLSRLKRGVAKNPKSLLGSDYIRKMRRTITVGDNSGSDKCIDESTAKKYFCDPTIGINKDFKGYTLDSVNVKCKSDEVCKNGRCVTRFEGYRCVDSDGGFNPKKDGCVKIYSLKDEKVVEKYCDQLSGQLDIIEYSCKQEYGPKAYDLWDQDKVFCADVGWGNYGAKKGRNGYYCGQYPSK